jgi:hypothetical protein
MLLCWCLTNYKQSTRFCYLGQCDECFILLVMVSFPRRLKKGGYIARLTITDARCKLHSSGAVNRHGDQL